MIDSCKRASAGRITAVIPYFGYARQDRKSKARDPISAKLVADLITAAGADRVLTMDLHAAQIQGFFDIPVDNLLGSSVLIPYIAGKFGVGTDDTVIVSPDLGSVTRARKFTEKLDMPLAIIDKRRPKAKDVYKRQAVRSAAYPRPEFCAFPHGLLFHSTGRASGFIPTGKYGV